MTAPDFTPEQLATLERIEAAPAAPESFIGSDGLTNDQRRALSPRIGNGHVLTVDSEYFDYLIKRSEGPPEVDSNTVDLLRATRGSTEHRA